VRARSRAVYEVAVTVRVPSMITLQLLPLTESQPLQFVKSDPADGIAVSVTWVLPLYTAEQTWPQLMSPSPLVTVPSPVPALVTNSV